MSSQVKLPGFGLPRDHDIDNTKNKFPHALDEHGRGLLSSGVFLRERRMLDFIGQITDKPDWHRKVFDDAIVDKWRLETKAQPNVENNDVYMSDGMFDNCMLELRDKAKRFEKTGFVNTLDAELTVVKSDRVVSDELAAALRKGASVLEDVPDNRKDWHPNSNHQVLDLLHPSLFPVVFGVTRALPTGKVPLDGCIEYTGKGEVTQDFPWAAEPEAAAATEAANLPGVPGQPDPWKTRQDRYQWLPTDVTFTGPGGTASIDGYINNLHPHDHKELYHTLAKYVDAAVPLWEETLSGFTDRRRFKVMSTDDEYDYYIPEQFKYQIPRDNGNGFHGDGQDNPDSDGEPDDDDYMYTQEYEDWRDVHRILMYPEPDAFVSFAEPADDDDSAKRVNLRDLAKFPEGLQVIFKLANIHLTPGGDRAEYNGGAWHIEGTLAERICATALYYYDEENITPSYLAFRQGIDEEKLMMMPAQSAFSSLEKYMGVENEQEAVMELGSVLTRPGRLLTFPNVLQHRVGSFKLQDATKPGHRKILAMFLVDPHRRVLSTTNVPPQRKDWWSELVRHNPVFAQLPAEMFTSVVDMVDTFPMSWEDATAIRADLMEKRSAFAELQDEAVTEALFSFCEH